MLESPEELDLPYIMKSRIIYVGEAYPKVVAGALSSARERGITVISNPGVNFNLFGEDAMNIVKTSDLVIMSSKEISLISKDLENGARYLLQEGPRAVIVTLGSAGSLLIRQEAIPEKVPAFRTKVVDTTGAGDVFTAGIIYGQLKGWDLLTCMRFGSAAAAMKVTHFGARSGLPTAKEVLDFMASQQ
ncbi:MAG: hypothetical protein DRN92_05135 [Thermoproteota archaeon]|nr:MAG: hypothetical protein DRN92_05135 [Candidatus Korarchaeota archaeon]